MGQFELATAKKDQPIPRWILYGRNGPSPGGNPFPFCGRKGAANAKAATQERENGLVLSVGAACHKQVH
jgi:hypothetical protein